MNENDVIKGLECCISPGCGGCPYDVDDDAFRPCHQYMMRDVQNLITRLKAEIEALNIANNAMYAANKAQDEEIERLQGAIEMYEEERKYHFEMSREVIAKAIQDYHVDGAKAKTIPRFIANKGEPK